MREESLPFESDPGSAQVPLWCSAFVLLAPAGWLLAFWSLVLRARLVTGEWPHGRSGNPFLGTMRAETIDPGELGLHASAVTLGMVGLVPLVPLVLLFLGAGVFEKRLRQPAWLVLAFLVASALSAATLFLDPGGFVDWFAD